MHNIISKVALITGAAKRIGAEIARTLHAQGFNIIIHYHHSIIEAQDLCHALNQLRPNSAIILHANLCDCNFENFIQSALESWGRLDVLVNNAAVFLRTPINQISTTAWDELLTINLKVPFFLVQAARKSLAQNQGCIVNLIDIHATRPLRDYSVYSMSKAGLAMMTLALAKELAPTIRVNGVSPGGAALWPEGENQLDEAMEKAIIAKIPLQRPGSPQSIAQAVQFFVNQDYITGQILAVDGGRSIG